jgi:hypothetical protein
MSNKLLNNFLAARSLIDRNPIEPGHKEKEKPNVMERPAPESDSVADIIATKPSKKVLMEFLKRKATAYCDMDSD